MKEKIKEKEDIKDKTYKEEEKKYIIIMWEINWSPFQENYIFFII